MNQNTQLTTGIHILCLLSLDPAQPLTSEYIAGSVNTHPVAIRRTLGQLRRAGLVTSRPGSGGGWVLHRAAQHITLRDVLEAVGAGSFLPYHHRDPNPACEVGANIQKALRSYYDHAEEALRKELERTTIQQVLGRVLAARQGEVSDTPAG